MENLDLSVTLQIHSKRELNSQTLAVMCTPAPYYTDTIVRKKIIKTKNIAGNGGPGL